MYCVCNMVDIEEDGFSRIRIVKDGFGEGKKEGHGACLIVVLAGFWTGTRSACEVGMGGSRLMHARVFHMLDLTLAAPAAPRKQLVEGNKSTAGDSNTKSR